MNLIINADDLGYNEAVNAATFELCSRNLLRSATLIMNAPSVDGAIDRLRDLPDCSFGVHLNLTEFRPLTFSPALQPLLKTNGDFDGDAVQRTVLSKPTRDAIFQEWSSQIARLIGAGIVPSHLDSHHHVHTLPLLFPILKKLQRRFSIKRVRLTKNIYGPDQPFSSYLLMRKRAWNTMLRLWYPTITTSGFTSLAEFHDLVTNGEIGRWVRDKTSTIIELMVHPGNPLFDRETALLYSDWASVHEFNLLSYSDL
jgi:predicted glycoside hydrolase/deacetylase ChbG (UPF0249 family)